MSDYYRPTIPQRKKEEWQKFLENNPELPADNVRELIEFAVNQIIWEKIEVNPYLVLRTRKGIQRSLNYSPSS